MKTISHKALVALETAHHAAMLRRQLYRIDSKYERKDGVDYFLSTTDEGTFATRKVGRRYSTRKVSTRKRFVNSFGGRNI